LPILPQPSTGAASHLAQAEDAVAQAFSADGALVRAQSGFAPRAGQTEMALAVARTVTQGGALVVEAGTGIGKTFAYLVPALLSGKPVLLSTATKALQDQLFGRDLPRVLRALALPRRMALLKGRSSYLCLHRLALARQLGCDPGLAERLGEIERWAQATHSGDLSELPQLDERSGIAALVTSTRENCLGTACAHAPACHVYRARREALGADVVVVNHHLLFADMAVRESGVAELLPRVHTVVIDEAHQLNEIGVLFLGRQLGNRSLQNFVRDLLAVTGRCALGLADWQGLAADLEAAIRCVSAVVRSLDGAGRWRWGAGAPEGLNAGRWSAAVQSLLPPLEALAAALVLAGEQTAELDRLSERCVDLLNLSQRFAQAQEGTSVRWLEASASQWRLLDSPHDIASALRSRLMGLQEGDAAAPPPRPPTAPMAWIFTSATLGDDERLSWFTEPCGLQDAHILRLPSPFDYGAQAALYVPADFPAPADASHSRCVGELVAPAAQVLGGRTLVLTTSLRALRAIGETLRECLPAASGIEVLVQGESPKRWLMDRFRKGTAPGSVGCVLVASSTFWEGFDVPGDRLQLVVIDKLPFPAPTDPQVQARCERVAAAGRSPFAHCAVPEAAVALKQGAGRLIRSDTDRGILVVCDPRLATMAYGKRLLRALPPMRRLHSAQEFETALAALTRISTTRSPCP
jgi:ATP-dependent DNA helicase DinG